MRLYELKRTARAEEGPEAKHGVGGSSSASLHTKTFGVDSARLFVGSFNFDERSAPLNTEMGLMIDSPALAGRLVKMFDNDVARMAYEVKLAADGSDIEWVARTPSGEKRYDTEPGTGILHRSWVWFLSILPIDWML